MTCSPSHPLADRGGPYTTDEIRQVVQYEGIWGLAPEDMLPAWDLVRRGLIEITRLHGNVVATALTERESS